MQTYTTQGDIELWHTRVGAYQVPCYCRPVLAEGLDRCWHVRQAIVCNPGTARQLAVEMDSCAVWMVVDGWILTDAIFKAQFTKAEGITPDYYFLKHGEPVNPREEEISFMAYEFNVAEKPPEPSMSFVEHLASCTNVGSMALLKTVYNAICNHMAHWLLIEQQPIDFGWFRIHGFPVRQNWKQILMARHPDLSDLGRMVDPEEKADLVAETGAAGSLQETTMIALRGEAHQKHVGWTVEVETTKAWDEYGDALEHSRLGSAAGVDYPTWWGQAWYSMRSRAIACLSRFAASTLIPAATVGAGGYRSRSGFVEHVPSGAVRPANVDDVAVRVVGLGGPAAVRKPNGEVAGFKEAIRVPKVPAFRLRLPNVRPSRGRRAG